MDGVLGMPETVVDGMESVNGDRYMGCVQKSRIKLLSGSSHSWFDTTRKFARWMDIRHALTSFMRKTEHTPRILF